MPERRDVEGTKAQGTTVLHVPRATRASRRPIGQLPQRFGRYELQGHLGRGGMGAVYLAHDSELDRSVAIKVPFLNGNDKEQDVVERFKREARSVAALHHPNICPVFDVGETNGTPYMTMAYIEGRPLSRYLQKNKRLAVRPVVHLVRKVALALEEAHRQGVVHRDLKPANIMINGRGEPVVMDFGLARRNGVSQTQLTEDGAVVGTPQYMAPEQISGKPENIGPACDVYSMGALLYVLLTLRLPHDSPDLLSLLTQIAVEDPSPPSIYRKEVDARLDEICLKALAKKPGDRHESAKELADELFDYLKRRQEQPARHPNAKSPAPQPNAKRVPPANKNERASALTNEFGSSVRFPIIADTATGNSAKVRRRTRSRLAGWVIAGAGGTAVTAVATLAALVSLVQAREQKPPVSTAEPVVATRIAEEPDKPLPTLGTANERAAVDQTRPVKLFILAGQPSMAGRVSLESLQQFADSGHLPVELRDHGSWVEREDVWMSATNIEEDESKTGHLSVGFGQTPDEIGVEYSLANRLGDFFDEQVIVVRVSSGPISLAEDARPPSSGGELGEFYEDLVHEVYDAMEEFEESCPSYQGQGIEVAGLVWLQGICDEIEDENREQYASNLSNLIRDLRRDLESPEMKVVVGEFIDTAAAQDPLEIRKREAVQTSIIQRPEFSSSVGFVNTRHDFQTDEPEDTMHMFHNNPQNLLELGDVYAVALLQLSSQ